jgi:hypothetical protein
VDIDRNDNMISAETLTTAIRVTGLNYSTGTDLNLNLIENGVNTGTFVATFKTGIQTDTTTIPQVIKAVQNGVAKVMYVDTIPSESSAEKQVMFSAWNAILSFDQGSYSLGDFAVITLTDAERNTNTTTAQTLLSDVFIQTSPGNSTTVRMVESGTDTGTFLGSIKIVSGGGTIEFSQIQAAVGDTLEITYIDEINTTGSSRIVTDTASVVEASTPAPTTTPTAIATATPVTSPTPPATLPSPTPPATLPPTLPPITPLVTPTPAVCEPEAVTAFPSMITLKRKKSKDVTVTVTGEDGCAVEGETVTATTTAAGRKVVKVSPESETTDIDGQVVFTIIAKNKTGKAAVKFKVKGVSTQAKVKVLVVK